MLGAIVGGVVGAAAGTLMIPGLAGAGYLGAMAGLHSGQRLSDKVEGSKFGDSAIGGFMTAREPSMDGPGVRNWDTPGARIFPGLVAGAGALAALGAFGAAWYGLSPSAFWSLSSKLFGAAVAGAAGAQLGARLCSV
ncbi:MAG: hypothetical protein ACYCW6_10515 [Candidatus Xenobia bacterium]